MKTIVIVIASLVLAGAAAAATPQFPERPSEPIRGELSSFERGFARMLARAHDAPVALPLRGELDPVDVLVARALATEAKCALRPVSPSRRR